MEMVGILRLLRVKDKESANFKILSFFLKILEILEKLVFKP